MPRKRLADEHDAIAYAITIGLDDAAIAAVYDVGPERITWLREHSAEFKQKLLALEARSHSDLSILRDRLKAQLVKTVEHVKAIANNPNHPDHWKANLRILDEFMVPRHREEHDYTVQSESRVLVELRDAQRSVRDVLASAKLKLVPIADDPNIHEGQKLRIADKVE